MSPAWTYQQKTGALIDPDGHLVGNGYSGHKAGLNNPLADAEAGVGPIPRGLWRIVQWYDRYKDKGPEVARLEPQGFDAHGRDGFLMHGDNENMNFSASDGCIVAGRSLRHQVRESRVMFIQVVA